MPQFRFDPINARWVAIASNRMARPMEFVQLGETLDGSIDCPFCRGAEKETPAQLEIWDEFGNRVETPGDDFPWLTRVVPNKFPAFPADRLVPPHETKFLDDVPEDFGPFEQNRLAGVQELIIPTPRHVSSFCELTESEAKVGLAASQHRIAELARDKRIAHAMLFMNCRSAAGASLAHAHLQLIGSPLVSPAARGIVDRNQQHIDEHDQTLVQSIVQWETKQNKRILLETDHFIVLCPFASRVAYQTWIVPKHSVTDFRSIERPMLDELALLCRDVSGRLDRALNLPAYNLMLHQAPFQLQDNSHWYVEIMPRLTRAAGLEWGTDIWINPVSPEDAAKRLRT